METLDQHGIGCKPNRKLFSYLTFVDLYSKMENMKSVKTMRWFAGILESTTLNDISKKSGVPIATLHRQTQAGSVLSAENVIKIAREFGGNIPAALIATGYVTQSELERVVTVGVLGDASDQELLDEIARRLDLTADGQGGVLDQPNPPVDLSDHRNKKNDGGAEENATISDLQRAAMEDDGDDGADLPE